MFAELFSATAKKMQRSELAALFKLTENPDVISFAGGFPDVDWFLDEIKEIAARIIYDRKGVALSYGPTPGLSELREFLAGRMARQGVKNVSMEHVIVTSGSLQGLEIVGRIFLDPGDRVVVEAPTYIGAITTLEGLSAELVQVPSDDDGMRIDSLSEMLADMKKAGRLPKLIYTVPTFQNPSGCTLSLDRRRELIAVAARYNVPVIEDNAYGELRYSGDNLPMLSALDDEGIVIHLGTFSKILSPGLRLGWILTRNAEVLEKTILVKQCSDQCSNTLGQLIALEYGRKGLIERQIAVSSDDLAKKKDATLQALEKYLPPGSEWTVPQGGFYSWVTLSGKTDTVVALKKAIETYKVAYVAGPSFYADRSGSNKLRICFSLPKVEQIPFGIEQLSKALGDN